jgi:hypothetical protein
MRWGAICIFLSPWPSAQVRPRPKLRAPRRAGRTVGSHGASPPAGHVANSHPPRAHTAASFGHTVRGPTGNDWEHPLARCAGAVHIRRAQGRRASLGPREAPTQGGRVRHGARGACPGMMRDGKLRRARGRARLNTAPLAVWHTLKLCPSATRVTTAPSSSPSNSTYVGGGRSRPRSTVMHDPHRAWRERP